MKDASQAHLYFSAECFNRTWALMDKPDRTSGEDEQMRAACHASLWHWLQRADCAAQNLSIGYWQLSRVYALLGNAGEARHYGELCRQVSRDETPFYQAYAQEALARAALVGQDRAALQQHLEAACRLAGQVTGPDERAMLEKDLGTLS